MKILLVEDDPLLREVYMTILEAHQLDFDTAPNGQEALELVEKQHYDIILLDLMMSVLDGIGFLKKSQIKKVDPSTKVIIFSNLSSGREIHEAMRLGVDRHVLKADLTPKGLIQILEATP